MFVSGAAERVAAGNRLRHEAAATLLYGLNCRPGTPWRWPWRSGATPGDVPLYGPPSSGAEWRASRGTNPLVQLYSLG